MAPKRAVKRSAVEGKAAKEHGCEIKKQKIDPQLQAVMEAIDSEHANLPPSCTKMLLAMIPNSLSVASDRRSAAQTRVVQMIEEALGAVRAKLQQAVDTEIAKVTRTQASKAELQQTTLDTEAAASEALAALQAKQAQIEEARAAVAAASDALQAAEAAQQEGDAALAVCRAERQEIQNAMDVHLNALCNETLDVEAVAKCDELTRIVARCGAEESLCASVSSCLSKPHGERSEFDFMVVDQLKQQLAQKIGERDAILGAGAEAESQRAQAVAKAKQQSEQAAAALESVKDDMLDLEVAQQNAAGAVAEAKREVAEAEIHVKKAVEQEDSAKSTLDHFLEHNLGAFNALRCKVSVDEPALQAGA